MWSTLHQQKITISVPRDDFLSKIVYNDALKKKDLRVALLLLTHLEGCKPKDRSSSKDASNFRRVDPKQIAIDLGMDKSTVCECIETLVEQEILEEGSSDAVSHGYRFTI